MSALPSTEISLNQYPTARSTSSQNYPPQSLPPRRSSSIPIGTSVEKASSAPKRPAGRRRVTGRDDAHDEHQREDLSAMGRLYASMGNYSIGARYAIYIVPVGVIWLIPIIIFSFVNGGMSKIGGVRVIWVFTWVESVWLVLWAMKFFAKAVPYVFSFFAGVVNSGTKKYALVLRNLEHTIMMLGWVIISFVLFEVLFSTSAAGNTPLGWTTWAKRVLASFLIATIIFTVEKVLVQMIGVSYHARSFNNKIAESKRQVYLLGLLFDASRALFPMYSKEFLEEDLIIHSNMEAFLRKELEAQGAHGTTVKHGRIINGIGRVGRYANRLGGQVNTVFGNIAQEITGKAVLSPKSGQSIVIESLEKSKSAKALATRLWYSFVVEGNSELFLNDMQEVLGPDHQDVAEECFIMLDQDENGDVSLEECLMRISEISTSRKAIGKSMHDVSQAIRALDNVLCSVALLISVFVLVSFLDTGFSTILSTTSTALLSLSFVFSVTAQEFLGSCIFLFVKHPMDIGDRVDIVGPDGLNRLIVETISLLYTGFKRIDDMQVIQVPNNVLNGLWINNISRSKTYLEKVDMSIDFGTSLEDIELLRSELESFVRAPENKRDFHPDIMIRVFSVGDMSKLQLKVEFRHKSNWAIENVRAARHSKLMCALVLALRKVPIFGPGGGGLPLGDAANPSYNVSISSDVAAASKDKAAKEAEAARMANVHASEPSQNRALSPTTSNQDRSALGPISETAAVDAITSLRYVGDLMREEHTDDINIDGSEEVSTGKRRTSSASRLEPPQITLQKTPSRSGKRTAGMRAPSNDQSQAGDMARVMSQAQASVLDQEAQEQLNG